MKTRKKLDTHIENISSLRAEAESLRQFIKKEYQTEKKKIEPGQLYSRPWESIVVKVKK
jgi:hypothetical protein